MALANSGHTIKLWAYEESVISSIREYRENPLYMPGVLPPETILPASSLREAIRKAEFVLTVMPSHIYRSLYEQMPPDLELMERSLKSE